MRRHIGKETSIVTTSLIGIGIGIGVVALYLVSGLVLAQWNVADLPTDLTLEVVGTFLLLTALTVLTFAVPIVTYIRFGVLAPAVTLVAVLLGWFGYAVATGILASEAVFGLGLYVIGLSPIYFICYALFGGVEYYARNRTSS